MKAANGPRLDIALGRLRAAVPRLTPTGTAAGEV